MNSLFSLDIPRRAMICSVGQEQFQPGMRYCSLLHREEEKWIRQDFCSACWQNRQSDPLLASQSSWTSRVPSKLESGTSTKMQEQALFLLNEALQRQGKEAQSEAFILALYLAKKRRLMQRQELFSAEGQPLILYELRDSEHLYFVPKIKLSELEVNALEVQLSRLFT